jgi:HSP20 family protein
MATDERKTGRRSSTTAKSSSGTLPARRDDWVGFWNDPFALWAENPMQRFAREMDRWFHGGRDVREGHWPFGRRDAAGGMRTWNPDVETFQRGDQFIARADLPGMKKEDITVNVTDDALTIEGERREEHEDQREGSYRSERTYGRFYRVIPLPEGAIAETARAMFNNGVLEVTLQAPPREVSRGRKLEIGESTSAPGSTSVSSTRTEPPSGTIYPE